MVNRPSDLGRFTVIVKSRKRSLDCFVNAMASNLSSDSYCQFLDDLKIWIQSAQLRAATAVNRELMTLYWKIGRAILAKQQQEGWGAKVIDTRHMTMKLLNRPTTLAAGCPIQRTFHLGVA